MLAYNKEISDSFHDIWRFTNLCTCVYELSVRLSVTRSLKSKNDTRSIMNEVELN